MKRETMKAIRFHEYGGPEKLVLEETEIPQPGEGEVLIKMKTAAVNPWDWKVRSGRYRESIPLKLPSIPGIEGSGIVEAVGPGATRFNKGDEVYGTIYGSYAEYAVAKEYRLFPKPGFLSFEEAASIAVGSQTAWSAVMELAGLKQGERILIHGAAGSVGSFAVQIARWAGAHIVVTAAGEQTEYVRQLGADEVIDYVTTRFETVASGMDAVIDTLGGEVQQNSMKILKRGGILVSVVSPPSKEEADEYGIRIAYRTGEVGEEGRRTLEKLVRERKITPEVRQVLPLAQAAQAQSIGEKGGGRGKIVLRMF
jgi:NADPH:quinone reductase-like Zn-dependent oxidoreductase